MHKWDGIIPTIGVTARAFLRQASKYRKDEEPKTKTDYSAHGEMSTWEHE